MEHKKIKKLVLDLVNRIGQLQEGGVPLDKILQLFGEGYHRTLTGFYNLCSTFKTADSREYALLTKLEDISTEEISNLILSYTFAVERLRDNLMEGPASAGVAGLAGSSGMGGAGSVVESSNPSVLEKGRGSGVESNRQRLEFIVGNLLQIVNSKPENGSSGIEYLKDFYSSNPDTVALGDLKEEDIAYRLLNLALFDEGAEVEHVIMALTSIMPSLTDLSNRLEMVYGSLLPTH